MIILCTILYITQDGITESFVGCRNRYCGSVPPPVVTSSGNMLMVKFASDESISSDGFSASYVTLNATTGTVFYKAERDSQIQFLLSKRT